MEIEVNQIKRLNPQDSLFVAANVKTPPRKGVAISDQR
jgi:hypothetical protein